MPTNEHLGLEYLLVYCAEFYCVQLRVVPAVGGQVGAAAAALPAVDLRRPAPHHHPHTQTLQATHVNVG